MDRLNWINNMFSALGSVFATRPRQAENADTRQEIRRHDPEYERRKNSGETGKDDPLDQQDGVTVSIEALRVFLKNFLDSMEKRQQDTSAAPASADMAQPPSTDSPPPAHPVSGEAAAAVSAYQTTARTMKPPSSILDSTDQTAQDLGLDGSEIRTIYALLRDLKALSEQNIEYLRIERSATFLQSLVNAVTAAKNAL